MKINVKLWNRNKHVIAEKLYNTYYDWLPRSKQLRVIAIFEHRLENNFYKH